MESLAKDTFARGREKEKSIPFPFNLSPFPDFCKKSTVDTQQSTTPRAIIYFWEFRCLIFVMTAIDK